jgi:hypothetical protein
MNFRPVATLACLLSMLCGLALLAEPGATLHLFGLGAVDRHQAQLGRHFGSALLMHAAAAWGLRTVPAGPARNLTAAALAAATASALVVTLQALPPGTPDAPGWGCAVPYGVFTLCWLRLALVRPVLNEQPA